MDPDSPAFGNSEAQKLLPRNTHLDGTLALLSELYAGKPDFMGSAVNEYAWQRIIEAAERHNDPGRFTTFIGYEFTPTPAGRHLHRNVIFKGSNVPERPFSSTDSMKPEDLWDWLDRLRAKGIEGFAIPHNMNQSDGLAFRAEKFDGTPMDAMFAEKRMRNEPIVEMSQIKGTSETHPLLSPNDEWAGFQIVQYYLNRAESKNPISVFKGGYVRDALKTGLQIQEQLGVNPYQVGVIGASDTHVGAGPFEEANYFRARRNKPELRGSAYPDHQNPAAGWEGVYTPREATHGTGGLAGVWAEENTRDALYSAMRRKETFATSGPRIKVRFFAGNLPEGIATSEDPVAMGYTNGIPMGGAIQDVEDPRFFVWATRDPNAGWLQRIQIVKGWLAGGETHESVYDVACSDGLVPDIKTHRCPDNEATVNLSDCSFSRDKGSVELSATWQDPDFKASERAFYYVRVLENPTCRWSTWDAIRLGISPNPTLPATHQERAWSSPIWHLP